MNMVLSQQQQLAGVEHQQVLARLGALSMDDIKRAAEVIKQVHAEQIETVRVLFADPHGTLRGKTVTAHALADAFTSGVHAPSTLLLKDVTQKTVFPVWSPGSDSPLHGVGDILMAPDPQTFRILPWSPHSALERLPFGPGHFGSSLPWLGQLKFFPPTLPGIMACQGPEG